MQQQDTITRRKRKIDVTKVVDGGSGRLQGYSLSPFSDKSIEIFVRNDADDIELKCSHHLTFEKARCLLAALQRAIKLFGPDI